MSLEGAKFICLDEAGNHGEIMVAKGRKFSMGYYMSCDLVLTDERAKGVHCEIKCDAFGRVTIRNFAPDNPILVNGSKVEIKSILLNNTKLSILDKEYLWQFPKSSSNEFEDLNSETVSTPQKQIGIPEQPPNSCPDFKLHRELHRRLTVHNFAYCIQSDEEGNISAESNDENITDDKEEKNQNEIKDQEEETSDKNQTNKDNIESKSVDNLNADKNRSVTPEPLIKNDNSKALLETPKMNLINCTNNKENNSTQKKKKQLLTLCQPSHVVITSFSPRETGIKVEKSFTAIIKPKVQVTIQPTTPRSVYSTPQSEMDIDDDERELMQFHTPSTSKKVAGTAAKVIKNSSMHLIDLTTPHKLRPGSPFLKSALKASTKKHLTETTETSSAKLAVDEQLGLSALPVTPVVYGNNSGLKTPSSVISVSSTDTSSVVEVTSDNSELGITPSGSAGHTTPMKSQARAGACTPKRTPQSLMKRALLTSAKKQVTTPQRGITTPRRESINRIPLRSNLALLGSPVTPKADKTESQLPRRQSMSTPTRKSMSARLRFDNSPTTSNFAASSPSSSRRSSINPISAARALPTSTPLAGSSNNSSFRNRAACKTSPLHKVRKSVGGIPLSSHISKARKSIALPASTSKLTSIKDKSPQQVISSRLVSRARKSCGTPMSTRARNMVTTAKTPPSILRDTQLERKPIEQRKAVLFVDKLPPEDGDMDDLSRTFIVDSDEEEDAAAIKETEKDKPKDATFSPEKDKKVDETDKASTTINTTFSPEKKTDNKEDVPKALNEEKDDHIKTIEIPVDVEEISATKEEKITEQDTAENNDTNQKTNNENKDTNNELTVENKKESIELNNEKQCETAKERNDENKEIINSTIEKETKDVNKEIPTIDIEDSLVTEESFAEIINDDAQANIEECVVTHNVIEPIDEIIEEGPCEPSQTEENNLKESSQTESQESFGDVVNITQDETEEDQLAPNVEQQAKLNEETQDETVEEHLAANIEQQINIAEEITESPNTTLDKERSEESNISLHKDKLETAEILEIGFGEESIVEILETEDPEDKTAEEVKSSDDQTKPETIIVTKVDNEPENIETEAESNVGGIDPESKVAEHLASEKKTIDEVQVLDDSEINIIEPKDHVPDDIKTESEVCNDGQTKSETIVLTEEDNVAENIETETETESKITEQLASTEKTIDEVQDLDDSEVDLNEQEDIFAENIETNTETESNVGGIVQESKITKHSASEEKAIDEVQILNDSEINITEQKNNAVEENINIDEDKPEVYKPIYEDITLEGSLIEKETKELEEQKSIKQPQYEDITLEGSLIEETEKSKCNPQEILEESDDEICLETHKDSENVNQLKVKIKKHSEDKIDQETPKDSEEPKEQNVEEFETETVFEEKIQLLPKGSLEVPKTDTTSVKVNKPVKDQETPKDSDNVKESKEETLEKLETQIVGYEEEIEIKEHCEDNIDQETPEDSEEPKEEILEVIETETVVEEKIQLLPKGSLEEPKTDTTSVKVNKPVKDQETPKDSDNVKESKEETLEKLEAEIVGEKEEIEIKEQAEDKLSQEIPTDSEEHKEETLEKLETETVGEEEETQQRLKGSLEEPETEAKTDNITETSNNNNQDNVEEMENIESPEEPLTANNKIEEHGLSLQEDTNKDHNPKDSQIVDQFELKDNKKAHEETENNMAEEEDLQKPDALKQNSSKLLEEIEDVLNKSDEIKQKHLDEMQSLESETPLTEEFECEETNLSDTEQNEQKTTLDKSPKKSKSIGIQESLTPTSTKNEHENVEGSLLVSKSPEKSIQEITEIVTKTESEEIVAETNLQSPDIVAKTENESLKMLAVEVKPETTKSNIEDIPSVSSIKKNIEKTTTLTPRRTRRSSLTTEATSSQAAELSQTPRRSTRRTSLSAEISSTSQTVEAATLTPRRSTRRASMSTESTNTGTPTKITTRRASLSTANETPLTPKRITSRRSSTTLDDKPLQIVLEAKTPRAKTPRKQLEQRIVEEKIEDMDAIIEEEEDEPTVEKVTSNKEIVSEQVMEDVEKETETLESKANEITSDIIAEDILKSEEKYVAEESREDIVSKLELKTKDVTDEIHEIDISESKANENTDEVVADDDILKTDETNVNEETIALKTETDEISEITNKEDLSNAAVTDEVSVETAFIEDKIPVENLKQLEVDETLLNEDNAIITTNYSKKVISKVAETNEISNDDKAIKEIESVSDNVITTNDSEEISDDKEIESISDNVTTTNDSEEIVAKVDESIAILDDQSADESKEIATPKKPVKIVADSPKTPVMTGMRELLKTPKAILNTPKYIGIRDLVRTPKNKSEHHEEETEKLAVLADLVKTPKAEISKELEENVKEITEVSTPKTTKKSTQLLTNTPKTPVMIGMRDLLKTPKTELNTPKLAGIRDLVKTPKLKVENEEEEAEKLVLAELVKTPKTESVLEENEPEEIATTSTKVTTISTPKIKKSVKLIADSPKTPIMTGMRELLKTPKADQTPKFAGIRNLVQTPKQTLENKQEESEKLAGVADLVKTPQPKVAEYIAVERLEEIPTTSAKDAYLRGVKELLKTPKSCSTPRFKGMRELMQTPKMCSTPLMGGIKELMNSPANKKDNENMDKFLKTPTAKNIMIPSLPSSAVIEKSTDSIEVSTEYDLNATNEGEMTNLEELFKTPVASRFVERITASYYGDESEDHDEAATIFNQTERETLQEKLNKSAEDAFDELTGQESQIQTPIRKIYPRKSLGLQTPKTQSPFTTADVLSDLPKTDVEEWIETLDQAEISIVAEDENEANVIAVEETESVGEEVLDDEISYLEDSFVGQNNDESTIPETCAKVYLNEKCLTANVTSSSEAMLNLSSIKKTNSKDPLAKTTTKLLTKVARPVTPMDAEISGIDLLDQTLESVQDEQLSMLEEPLVVEEASIFEEHLVVSDNDSEADVTLNNDKEIKEEQHSLANETLGACDDEDEYDLSEPLLVSDNEELDQSLELKENLKTTQELLEEENNSQDENETTSLYIKNEDKSSTNDPLESELAMSQEQLFDVIDLETSEIDDDSSKESNEANTFINQKPESINDSKDVEKEGPAEETDEKETEIIENFVIEDDVIENEEETEIIEDSMIEDDVIEKEDPESINDLKDVEKEVPAEETVEKENEIIDNFVIEDDVIENEEEPEIIEDSMIEDDVIEKEDPEGDEIEIIENSMIVEEDVLSAIQEIPIMDEDSSKQDSNDLDVSLIKEDSNEDSENNTKSATDNEPIIDSMEIEKDSIIEDSFTKSKLVPLQEPTSMPDTVENTEELSTETLEIVENRKDNTTEHASNELEASQMECIMLKEITTDSESKVITSTEVLHSAEASDQGDMENVEEILTTDETLEQSEILEEYIEHEEFNSAEASEKEDTENVDEILKTDETLEQSEVLEKEIEMKKKLEVSIKEIRKSEDLFKDDSLNEISNEDTVETVETSSTNKTEIIETLKVSPKECNTEFDQESEDIFMDSSINENSKVDDSFADKATNDEKDVENESAMVEVTTKEMANTESDTELTSSEATEFNKNDVAIEDDNVSKEVLSGEDVKIEDNSKEVQELCVKNEEQLEEILTVAEISEDENLTASDNVMDQLREESSVDAASSVNEISETIKEEEVKSEQISQDQPPNTSCEVIDEPSENLKDDDESVSQTYKDIVDVEKSITEAISENISEPEDYESTNMTNTDDKVSNENMEPTEKPTQNVDEMQELVKTDKEPFDISTKAQTVSELSKELSEDINDIVESENKVEETNDESQLKDLDKETAEESPETSEGNAEQDLKSSEESKTELIQKSVDLEISQTIDEESQQSDIPKTVKQESEQEIITTDKDPQNSEIVKTSTKDISFEEKKNKLVEESIEVDVANPTSNQTADNNIENVQTYDFKVKITDTESNIRTETKSDNSKLHTEILRKDDDSNATPQTVGESIENSTNSSEFPEVTVQSNVVAIEKFIEVKESTNKEAEITVKETSTVVVKDTKETVRPQRRKRTASDSSQGSVHEDDNKSTVRRGRRKVQKTPVEETLAEEVKENEDHPAISEQKEPLVEQEEQNIELPAFSNHKEETVTEQEQEQNTKLDSVLILEDAERNLAPDVLKAFDAETAEKENEAIEKSKVVVKRGRRKPTVSESSQGSVDNECTTRKGRRKLPKTQIEQTLLEVNEEELPNVSKPVQEIKEKTLEEHKEEAQKIEHPKVSTQVEETNEFVLQNAKAEEQLPEVPKETKVQEERQEEIKEPAVKRGRRKKTVSESSQGSVNGDDTTHSQRVRRKVQKTCVEEPLVEEELPTTSTDNIAEKEDTLSALSPATDELIIESDEAKNIEQKLELPSVTLPNVSKHPEEIKEVYSSEEILEQPSTVLPLKDELVIESTEALNVQVTEPLIEEELPNVPTPADEIKEVYSPVAILVEQSEKTQKVEIPQASKQEEETNEIVLQNVKAEEQLPEVLKETKDKSVRQKERKEQAVKRGRRKDEELPTSSTANIAEKEDTLSVLSPATDELIIESDEAKNIEQKLELPSVTLPNVSKHSEEIKEVYSSEETLVKQKEEAQKVELPIVPTQEEETENAKAEEQLPEVSKETKVQEERQEEIKEPAVKRGRRKKTVSESSQGSVNGDDTTHSQRVRRKVQKTRVGEPLIEEDLATTSTANIAAKEEKPSTVLPPKDKIVIEATVAKEIPVHDVKVTESLIEEQQDVSSDLAQNEVKEDATKVEQETHVPTKALEDAIKQTVKHGRRKQTVSESSQDSTHDEVTSTRRGRRNVLKTSVDKPLVEEKHESEKLLIVSTSSIDVLVEQTENVPKEINQPSEVSPEGSGVVKVNEIAVAEVKETAVKEVKKTTVEEVKESTVEAVKDTETITVSKTEIIDIKPQNKVQDDHTEKDPKLKLKTTKTRGKRTRTASESSQGSVADEEPNKRRARLQKPIIDEAIVEETHKVENLTTDNLNLNTEVAEKSSTEETVKEKKDDEQDVEHQTHSIDSTEDIPDKPQTSGGEAVAHKAHVKQQDDKLTKIETIEIEDETKNIELTEVEITEVNLEPENQHSSPEVKDKMIRGRRGARHHVVAEDDEHHEIKPVSKRRAAVAKIMTDDIQESGPVSKRRVGRRKLDNEQEEHAHVTADDCKTHDDTSAETIVHEEPKKGRGRRKKDEHPTGVEHHKTSEDEKVKVEVPAEECTHTETASSSSKRRVGRRKLDHEQEEHDDGHEEKSNEEPKTGRGRKKKDEHPEEHEQPTTSHSPQAKPRGRKRNEPQTDNLEQGSKTDTEKDDQTQQAKIKLLTADAAPHTPQRATAAPRRGRKASAIDVDSHAHIVAAESAEDTPSKRPLRKAATAYHNYDETSNDAVKPTKTKKKTDSPRKSLEAAKISPSATVTTAQITAPSPTASNTPAATTARGRTRKPTARVQQFLEEERAKAETPKKRGLLAAVTTDLTDTPTPQRMPARRGRKPSTIDVDVDTVGTPQATKRGRGKAITHTEELEKETAKVIQEKETEPTTPPKGRRGGRKAKITAEDQHHDEDEQPPAKKSPLVLEAEKQETSPELEGPTPTRTAGRRGAATAAKARIEEDALAAAAIDPPKRARAKKVPTAKLVAATIAAAAATDTEGHSSEIDEEQQTKSKSLKAEDLNSGEDKESDIVEKPVNKRGARKVAASTSATESPAVPPKRGRKAKTASEATDTETVLEVKATRGAGRGRKNVHFDEMQAAEKAAETLEHLSATEQTSEESAAPAKRGTRTRRK